MKWLYADDYMNNVVASTENPNYPGSNVENDHANEVWKATTNIARLTCSVNALAEVIAVANINATSIIVTLRIVGAINWSDNINNGIDWSADENVGIVWENTPDVEATYDISSSKLGQLWATWTPKTVRIDVLIDFTSASGTVVQVGVVRAGLVKSYRDPEHGIREGLNDYSIRKRYNSGGLYTLAGDSERTLAFRIFETREQVWAMMYDVIRPAMPGPIFVRCTDVYVSDWEWIIFAIIDEGVPVVDHAHPEDSYIDVALTEAI